MQKNDFRRFPLFEFFAHLLLEYFGGFNFIMEHLTSIDFQLKLVNTSMRLAHHIEMNIKKEVNF